MPTVQLFTSLEPTDAARDTLLGALSKTVAEVTGKDERWVMTCLTPAAAMTFGGTAGPTCFVRVVSIGGFTEERSAALVEKVCDLVETRLGVPKERTYVELCGAERHLFGHAGRTFG